MEVQISKHLITVTDNKYWRWTWLLVNLTTKSCSLDYTMLLSLLKKNLFRIFNENIQTFSKVKIEQRTLIAPHRGAFAQLSRSCLVCFIPFCFALLQILSFTPVYLNGCGLVTKWCQTLATTWTVACQAPLSMGFPRQEYWSGLPFPSLGNLLHPGIQPMSPAWQADSLPLSHLGSMHLNIQL